MCKYHTVCQFKWMQKLWHASGSDFCTQIYEMSPDIIYICCSMKSEVHCKIKHSKCDEFNNILSVCQKPTYKIN